MLFDDKTKGIAQAYLTMLEANAKKKMDPVGGHDADIDNDGDKDKSDQYLIKRRAAISKSVKEDTVDEASCGTPMKSAKKEAIEITIGGKSEVSKKGMKDKEGGDEEDDEDEDGEEIEVKTKKSDDEKDGKKKKEMPAFMKKDTSEKFDPLKHVKNPTPGEKKAAKDVKRSSYADRAAMLRSAQAGGRLKEKFDALKHVKNPTPGEKKAAKDVKRSSYADRAAMLRSAQADGRLKEELKGNQHKLDKNKNGKLDKHDFKMLRKESVWNWEEIIEASEEDLDALIENLDGDDLESFMSEFNELAETYKKAPPNETTVKTGKEQLIPRAQAEKAFADMHTQVDKDHPFEKDQHDKGVKSQAPTRPGDKRANQPMKTLKDIRK